jgi:hypothetical protein
MWRLMVNKSLRHFCLLGGLSIDPNMVFTLSITIIGSERFEYFKVLVVEERRIACTFPRRSTDLPEVIPVLGQKRAHGPKGPRDRQAVA